MPDNPRLYIYLFLNLSDEPKSINSEYAMVRKEGIHCIA